MSARILGKSLLFMQLPCRVDSVVSVAFDGLSLCCCSYPLSPPSHDECYDALLIGAWLVAYMFVVLPFASSCLPEPQAVMIGESHVMPFSLDPIPSLCFFSPDHA